MSQETIARYRVRPLPRKRRQRRRLDERFVLRFPRVASIARSGIFRLSPGSRLRRAIISTACRQGFDALRRGQYEAMASVCAPDVKTRFTAAPGEMIGDLDTEYRSRDGLLKSLRSWSEAWSDWAMEPQEILDFGDRLLVRGRFVGRGRHSGITTEQPGGVLITLRGGWIAEQDVFLGSELPLQAAGVSEQDA
jgi:ketosteroid isomerase-like protein